MSESLNDKISAEDLRAQFDGQVDRFSDLQRAQSSFVDAPLVLDLVTSAGLAVAPQARSAVDLGCGGGNYALKLAMKQPELDMTLVDFSGPMLDRACQRVSEVCTGRIARIEGDLREVDLGSEAFDIATAGAVLHHLREADEWRTVFAKVHAALKPGGSFWIADIIAHDAAGVQALMWERFGRHLVEIGGDAFRDDRFASIQRNDSPRSLAFQLDLLGQVGFASVEVLHKNTVFAAFGGIKAG